MIKETVDKLEDLGIIQESKSEVALPIIVQKGKPRFCIDLREMNAKTKANRYTLPRQDSIFRALAGMIFLSLSTATKIIIESLSLLLEDEFFEFLRAPFGLKSASTYFQRAINAILG